MASFEEKTRKEYRENLVKMCKNNGFILDDTSLKYLYQFKIKQEQQGENQEESSEANETINTTNTSTITNFPECTTTIIKQYRIIIVLYKLYQRTT
jgi:hypothetical protein